MGFFDQVGGFFKGAWDNAIKPGISEIWNTGKGFVTNVTSLPSTIIGGSQALAGKLIDKGSSTLESLGQSLSMPLLIGAGVLGGILLLKK
jgi:hypothetical protein